MKPKLLFNFLLFFTLLLFGGGRLLATTDTVWHKESIADFNYIIFSPDDSKIAAFGKTFSSNQIAAIYNTADGSIDTILANYYRGVFNSNGSKLIMSGKFQIDVFDTQNWSKIDSFTNINRANESIDYNPVNNTIMEYDFNKGFIGIWNLDNHNLIDSIDLKADSNKINDGYVVENIFFGGIDRQYLVFDGAEVWFDIYNKQHDLPGIFIANPVTDSVIGKFEGDDKCYMSIDRRKAAQVGFHVNIFDIESGIKSDTLLINNNNVRYMSFTPDNCYLAVAYRFPYSADSSSLDIWDIQNKNIVHSYIVDPIQDFTSCAISNNSEYIVIANRADIYLFNLLTTNLTEKPKDSEEILYPNPSDKEINIDLSDLTISVNKIQILDINGNKVLESSDYSFSRENSKISIRINMLVSGTYFLNLFTGNKTITKKIIIKH